MDALNRLTKLHLVADEDDIAGGGSHRNDIGHRNLASFVDNQVVKMPVKSFMGKKPSGPRQKGRIQADVLAYKFTLDEFAVVQDAAGVAQKKSCPLRREAPRALIDFDHDELSVAAQCALDRLAAFELVTTKPVPETTENLRLMRLIDEQYLKTPFYGSRQMTVLAYSRQGYVINRKRVQRLMRLMGLEAIYPGRAPVAGRGT